MTGGKPETTPFSGKLNAELWRWCSDHPADAAWVIQRMRHALESALPGLRDLVNQECPDPDVAARDRQMVSLCEDALKDRLP